MVPKTLENMGRMSGEPQPQVFLDWLNRVSNSTGFSDHPLKQNNIFLASLC